MVHWLLLHQDNFNRDDEGLEGAVMSDGVGQWAEVDGKWSVTSNVALNFDFSAHQGIWDTVMSAVPIQAAQAAVLQEDSGVIVRHNAESDGAQSYYMVHLSGGTVRIYRCDSAALTSLGTVGSATLGDTLRIEAEGTTIRAYRNGTLLGSVTDATYTTGRAGLYGGADGISEFDNFAVYVPDPGAVGGSASGTSTIAAVLRGVGVLAAVLAGAASLASTIVGRGAVAGTVTATTTASATLRGTGAVAGAATGTATPAATVTGRGALAGQLSAAASLAGSLVGTATIAGTVAGAAATTGALTGQGAIAGAIVAPATAVATIVGVGDLVGSGAGAASGAAAVIAAADIGGSTAGATTAVSTIVGIGDLAAATVAAASAAAAIVGTGDLQGAATGVATGTGTFEGTGDGELAPTTHVTGTRVVTTAVTGDRTTTTHLEGSTVTTTAREFSFHCGTKRVIRNTIADGESETPGEPLNLNGMTVRWALARVKASGEVETESAVSKEGTVDDAGAGECSVELDAADTAELRPGKYWQEWQVQDEDGAISITTVGPVTLLANIAN